MRYCQLQCAEHMLPCLWVPFCKESSEVPEAIPEVSAEATSLKFCESSPSFTLYASKLCPLPVHGVH